MSNDPSGESSAKAGAPDVFQNFIEERYAEWEQEFGDAIQAKRTAAFDPKN